MSETNDALLELLVGKIKDDAKGYADKQISEMKEEIAKSMTEVKAMAKEMVKQAKESVAKCGHIVNLGTVEKPQFEKTHSSFDKILKVLASSKRKEKNVMLVGGAGGGKTHLVKQIADTLKLPFYPMSVGLQTTKSDLLGFINATGTYMPSCIRQAYENGGVLLLDEFDAAHAGVVTILNSLLANGHCSFPDKVVNKHKDFICLVACNTFGTGANMEYIGRNRLDGATLDRFITIEVGYDPELEKGLTNNKNWFDLIQMFRKNAEKQGIKQIISPRASMDGADLLDAGFGIVEVLNMTVFKGCSKEIQEKLLGSKSISTLESVFDKKEEETKAEVIDKDGTSLDLFSEDFSQYDYVCSFKDGEHKVIHTSEKFKKAAYKGLDAKSEDYCCIRFSEGWCSNGLSSTTLYCSEKEGVYTNMMSGYRFAKYNDFFDKCEKCGFKDDRGMKYLFIVSSNNSTVRHKF